VSNRIGIAAFLMICVSTIGYLIGADSFAVLASEVAVLLILIGIGTRLIELRAASKSCGNG